ncbi:MAG: M61 family metallopeptidase [Phycisphaerales bacterium JB059]
MMLWCVALIGSVCVGQEARNEYIVDLSRAHAQLVTIELILHDTPPGEVELILPTWRPGRYEILDPSGTIRRFEARDDAGAPLGWEKVRKNAWVVRTDGGTVRAKYELYANSIRDRTRYADDSHAFLSGSAVFLYTPDRRAEPALIHLEGAPSGWTVATGLERAGDDPRLLFAPNYDVLVDSPIEIGELQTITFDVEGRAHEIAVWGEGAYDLPAMARDFEQIVRDQLAVFGEMPYERYVFLLHVGPGLGGGTEHLNSTIMQTRPTSFTSESAYRGFLGLVSHEFFHTWNVKQLRPAGIHPYDYEKENYTKLLWVAEGTTSYYDDLSLVRAGLIDTGEYFKRIGGSINSLRRSPGRKLQSLEESSFDAWVKFSQRTPDSGNCTISFYSKGALVSLMLDLTLRMRTDGAATLDNAMRELYERHPLSGDGFTPEDVIEVCNDLTGEDMTDFFEAHVSGVEELDFEPLLEWAGVELYFKPDDEPWRLGREEHPDGDHGDHAEASERIDLGLSLTTRNGNVHVRSVREGGACFDAGIIADDELVAINERRVESTDLKPLLEGIEAGDAIRVLIARRGALLEREVRAKGAPAGSWKLRRVKNPSEAQKSRYRAWLGQAWPGEDNDTSEGE